MIYSIFEWRLFLSNILLIFFDVDHKFVECRWYYPDEIGPVICVSRPDIPAEFWHTFNEIFSRLTIILVTESKYSSRISVCLRRMIKDPWRIIDAYRFIYLYIHKCFRGQLRGASWRAFVHYPSEVSRD